MRTRALAVVGVVLGASIASGCDRRPVAPIDEADAASDAGPLTLDSFAGGLATAICTAITTCCPHPRDVCEKAVSDEIVELGRGWTFDASRAAACLAAYRSGAPCWATAAAATDDARTAACAHVFAGAVPPGGACTIATECASSGAEVRCVGADGSGARGSCVAVRTVDEGAACSVTEVCASGLDCWGAPPTCVRPIAIGQPCAPSGERCVEGAECKADASGASATCTAATVPPSAKRGEPCSQTTTCEAGLYCASTGACATLPARNEPCGVRIGSSSPRVCAGDAVCSGGHCRGIAPVVCLGAANEDCITGGPLVCDWQPDP